MFYQGIQSQIDSRAKFAEKIKRAVSLGAVE